jgi:hypothetical protein
MTAMAARFVAQGNHNGAPSRDALDFALQNANRLRRDAVASAASFTVRARHPCFCCCAQASLRFHSADAPGRITLRATIRRSPATTSITGQIITLTFRTTAITAARTPTTIESPRLFFRLLKRNSAGANLTRGRARRCRRRRRSPRKTVPVDSSIAAVTATPLSQRVDTRTRSPADSRILNQVRQMA